ncbi:hypothetical protein PR001_g29878, partial [Phytophthora rubi]
MRYQYFLSGLRNREWKAALNTLMVNSIEGAVIVLLAKNMHQPVEDDADFVDAAPSKTPSENAAVLQMMQMLQQTQNLILQQQQDLARSPRSPRRPTYAAAAYEEPAQTPAPTLPTNATVPRAPFRGIRQGPDQYTQDGQVVCGRCYILGCSRINCRRTSSTCPNCGMRGHIAVECETPRNQTGNGGGSQSPGRRYDNYFDDYFAVTETGYANSLGSGEDRPVAGVNAMMNEPTTEERETTFESACAPYCEPTTEERETTFESARATDCEPASENENPNETSEDVTENPNETSEDATENPYEASEDANENPCEASEDANENPCEASEDANENPNETSEDVTENPYEASEDANENPCEASEDANENPCEASEDANENPYEASEDANEKHYEASEDAKEDPCKGRVNAARLVGLPDVSKGPFTKIYEDFGLGRSAQRRTVLEAGANPIEAPDPPLRGEGQTENETKPALGTLDDDAALAHRDRVGSVTENPSEEEVEDLTPSTRKDLALLCRRRRPVWSRTQKEEEYDKEIEERLFPLDEVELLKKMKKNAAK